MNHVQALDLSFNTVCRGRGAVEAVASMLRHNSTLTHLDLSHNAIGGEFLDALSQGLNLNSTLCGLHMQG